MKDVFWLVQNTLRNTFKKKRNIILFVFTPLIGLFLAILSQGGINTEDITIGVVQEDQGSIASDTVSYLKGLNNVKFIKLDQSKVSEEIINGKADCAIILEDGFSKSVVQGSPGHIQMISVKGAGVTGYIKNSLYRYIDNISAMSKAAAGDQKSFEKMYKAYHHPSVKLTAATLKDTSKEKDMTSQTIGFLIMIMLISAGSLSETILKEKENRTYFRLLSTPINAKKYILSNMIVSLIVMLVQIVVTMVLLTKVFKININMPTWELGAILLVFSLVAIGFSQITVAFATTIKSSSALQNLLIVPTCLIAGCFFPIDIMPKALQRIADFLPQHWVLDTITKLQNGELLQDVYLNFLLLIAFALVFFLIALMKFSRNSSTHNFV